MRSNIEERRGENGHVIVSAADEVFDRPLVVRHRGAATLRARRWRPDRGRAGRAAVRAGKRAPIPAPGATPPLSSPQELSYGDLLLSQFQPLRAPRAWPQQRGGSRGRARGRRLGARERGELLRRRPPAGPAMTTSTAIQCADAPADRLAGVAAGDRTSSRDQPAPGPHAGLVGVGPLRLLAGPAAEQYRWPSNASTPNPILLINQRYDPNTSYANAVRAERTWATRSSSPTRATATCSSRIRANVSKSDFSISCAAQKPRRW